MNNTLSESESIEDHNKNAAESRLTLQILQMVDHYKQEDPGKITLFVIFFFFDKFLSEISFNSRLQNIFDFIWKISHFCKGEFVFPVPDPMPIPEIKKSLSLATLHMKNIQAHGMSKFRIKYINSNLNDMKVNMRWFWTLFYNIN